MKIGITRELIPNPIINAKKIFVCQAVMDEGVVLLEGYTEYRDNNDVVVPGSARTNYRFTTDGNMVNMYTGQLATMIHVPVLDGNGEPTGETDPERPADTVEEIVFLHNIPKSVFADNTIRGVVRSLIYARIDRLDQQGKFNS